MSKSTLDNDKRKLHLLLLLVFISCVGLAIAYPIFPPLFLHPHAHGLVSIHFSEEKRSTLLGLTLAAFPIGVFFGSPFLGGLADRFGKGKVMLASLAGASAGYVLSGIAIEHHNLTLLIISRLFTGFVEGVIAIARAMASELTTLSRQKVIGRVNGVACTAYIAGPLIGGFFSNHHLLPFFNYSFPFYIGATLCLITSLLSLKTFLKADNNTIRKKEHQSTGTSLNIIKQMIQYSKYPHVLPMLIASTFFTFGVDIYYNIFPILLTLKWHFHPWHISLFLSISTLALALSCTTVIDMLQRYKIKPLLSLSIGITVCSATVFLCAHINSQWSTLVDVTLLSLTLGTVTTQLTSQLSHFSCDSIQGSLMGSQLGLRMLGDAVLCFFGSKLIVYSQSLPFIIAALAMLTTLIFIFNMKKSIH